MKRPADGHHRPFGTFHLLMHCGHLLEQRCRAGLAEEGLHHGQARVLMTLAHRGDVVQARLAGGMDIAAPTLSVMLRKLEADGLVSRRADERDERAQRVSITAKGRGAVAKIEAVWGEAEEAILAALAREDAGRVRACLVKVRDGLGGRSPEL